MVRVRVKVRVPVRVWIRVMARFLVEDRERIAHWKRDRHAARVGSGGAARVRSQGGRQQCDTRWLRHVEDAPLDSRARSWVPHSGRSGEAVPVRDAGGAGSADEHRHDREGVLGVWLGVLPSPGTSLAAVLGGLVLGFNCFVWPALRCQRPVSWPDAVQDRQGHVETQDGRRSLVYAPRPNILSPSTISS